MKFPKNNIGSFVAAATLAASLGISLDAGAQTHYNAQSSGSSVRVDGTSTTHDWEMEGKLIGGFFELGAGVKLDKTEAAPAGLQDNKMPAKAHVFIPVDSIHSKAEHLPGVMDDLMQKHMKADKCPRIEFKLSEMTFKGPHTAGKPFDFDATGDLVIAGVTNKAAFPVSIDCMDGGKIKISGTAPVKMTAYGIEPPAPNIGLGMMKCGDDVKINFDWMLQERK